jgi:hypothetical protein
MILPGGTQSKRPLKGSRFCETRKECGIRLRDAKRGFPSELDIRWFEADMSMTGSDKTLR